MVWNAKISMVNIQNVHHFENAIIKIIKIYVNVSEKLNTNGLKKVFYEHCIFSPLLYVIQCRSYVLCFSFVVILVDNVCK